MASVLEQLAQGFKEQRFFDQPAPVTPAAPQAVPAPQPQASQPQSPELATLQPITPTLFIGAPQAPAPAAPRAQGAQQGAQQRPVPQVGPTPEVQAQADTLLAALLGAPSGLIGAQQQNPLGQLLQAILGGLR